MRSENDEEHFQQDRLRCCSPWAAFSPAAHAVNDLPGGPAVRQLNLHAAATRIAAEQAWLHWFMLIACTVIFIAVFSVMFYSIWKHRKSRRPQGRPTSTSRSPSR